LTIIEDETFAKSRQEEEKLRKVKAKLDKVVAQIDAILSLYSNVLSCRSPATNGLFSLEIYLLLKIKAIKVDKSVELKTTEQFTKCCKEHGIKSPTSSL